MACLSRVRARSTCGDGLTNKKAPHWCPHLLTQNILRRVDKSEHRMLTRRHSVIIRGRIVLLVPAFAAAAVRKNSLAGL